MARSPDSRLWLKSRTKLKLWRLDGKVTRSRLWLNLHCHKSSSEGLTARSLAPGFRWKSRPKLKLWRLDGKVTRSRLWLNSIAKGQALKTRWQGRLLQALVKIMAKTQASKTRWQDHPLQALVKIPWQKLKLWRLDGKVTRSRLWLKSRPKLKLWRLDGKVTRSRLWLNLQPQVKLWRLDGKVTRSRFSLKSKPQNSSSEDSMARSPRS